MCLLITVTKQNPNSKEAAKNLSRASKNIKFFTGSWKKWTLLLCVVLILTISIGATFSYVMTGTPTLINLFLNGLDPDGDLVIQKTIAHPFGETYSIPEDLTFTFEVKLGDKYAGETVKTTRGEKTADENGCITVTVAPGGRTTVYDIDDGTLVTVTETRIGAGFTPDEESQSITIRKHQDNTLTFKNTYSPQKANTDALTVSGVKTLVGREWIEGDSFTFALEVSENGTWTSVGTQTITYEMTEQEDPENPGAMILAPKPDFDKFDFSQQIRTYAFEKAGTYSFRVTEVEGTIGGLTYDKAESRFDILVGDVDMDGFLEIQAVTAASANTTVENTTVNIAFQNEYAPVGSDEGYIQIKKAMTDTSGQNKSPAGYTFELYDEAGNLIAESEPTNAAGETSIRLVYEPTDAGKTFTYILKERNGGQTVGAYVYDGTEYKIQVSVVDNLDGTVSAYVYDWQEQAEPIQEPAATEPTEGSATVTEGETTPDPTDAVAGEETTPTDAPEITDGSISDGETAEPSEPTSVTEMTDAAQSIDAENISARPVGADGEIVSADVTGDGGTEPEPATTAVVIPEGATDTYHAAFTNKYDPQDATASISGEKVLSGRNLKDGEFTFLLYETDNLFALADGARPIDSAVNAAGIFRFDTLTFNKVGTYYYVVTEDPSSNLGGVAYDSSHYLVTIVVTDENGVLTAETSITDGFGEEKDIKFVNSYQAASVSMPLGGKKTLSGAVLKDYTFCFQLYAADENFTVNSTAFQTVTSNGDGDFCFADLTFTKAGTYRYVVTEDGSAAVEGMTYDDTVYQIIVVVSDPGDGQLVISEFSMAADGKTATEILFENTYVEPTKPIKPTDPDETTAPTDTTNPDAPSTPDETTKPDDSTKPTVPGNPDSPGTGDDSRIILWIIIMVLSGAAVIVLLVTKRRKRSGR